MKYSFNSFLISLMRLIIISSFPRVKEVTGDHFVDCLGIRHFQDLSVARNGGCVVINEVLNCNYSNYITHNHHERAF